MFPYRYYWLWGRRIVYRCTFCINGVQGISDSNLFDDDDDDDDRHAMLKDNIVRNYSNLDGYTAHGVAQHIIHN